MNYIKQLQSENAQLRAELEKVNNEINHFKKFLLSDKFVGTAQDGSRKDWISTGDVQNWLTETQMGVNFVPFS